MHEKELLFSFMKIKFPYKKMKFPCMKNIFCPETSIGENSMHEVVYSPTNHEHLWAKKIMLGAKFSCSCIEILV